MEIHIQFRHVPGNIYHESFGHNIDLATNEPILHDVLEEAIPVRVNNKVPGLGLQLDASELNLLYKALQFMELVLFLLVFCVDILHVLVFCVDTTGITWRCLIHTNIFFLMLSMATTISS